ncbi:hypothetical protein O181_045112 [Austropuccinia psidii MF-1]|uniref:Uncharacterized protein n=1 Tax=Austropuccinia psidii MF-1 TaxID=1389203 RepID=A0A9Q3DT65_9BASI|nr:hypothetical protein [Austropuccinia psidii MF-1]
MEHKWFNLDSHWEDLEERSQEIFLRGMSFKDFIQISKGCNPKMQFKLLKEKAAKTSKNQATIQAIEEKRGHKEKIMNPSGSQGVYQPSSLVVSHHSELRKAGAKSHHYSQLQEDSRRRE